MDNNEVLPNRFALKDWEAWLAPQVRQVELLGEIPITAGECARLGKVIGLRVRSLGHGQALGILRHEYPCAFAVYLAAQGMYGYEGGDFWSEVIQVTGLKRERAWEVGQAFEKILENLGLPLFYDMRAEKAHRYVSLILAHGGIPNYCLPDFFANMLQPSVLRAQYADMTAGELIDEWGWRSSVQYFTDKPVIRFLAHGGQVAEDFVRRCREMAWEVVDVGVVPEPEAVGLPKRVVEAYRQWLAEQGEEQVQRETAERWRLHKPEIRIDPWGEGVLLDLPPQQIPATAAQAEFAWQVVAGEQTHTVPVRVRRAGFDLKTEAESIVLSQPVAVIEVSLLADDQVKRTWHYQGLDDEHPLLVFDAERFTLLPWQHSLPARQLGLLYPAGLELQAEGACPDSSTSSPQQPVEGACPELVEGRARLLEELPRMPWGWAGFRGEIWDLSQATGLALLRDGEKVIQLTLRPDESSQRPHLVGGQVLLLAETFESRPPVYIGPPPAICIPLAGRRDLDEELVRWRLTVRNKWVAWPEVNITTTLADLSSQLVIAEKHIDLDLGLRSLLGKTPFGNYLVRLRGPLGRDAEFTLRMIPHLVICGHETLHLPDAQGGPQGATLLVETSAGAGLECQESELCRIQLTEQGKDHWQHELWVAPDVTDVELTLVRPLPDGEAVRVPLPVTIRRLRWALVGEGAGPSRREWSGHIIKRPVDALLQTQSPCLLVALPLREADGMHLFLRLLDVDTTELQVMELTSPPWGQRLWRFDLAAFLDTVRASPSPILRFELVAWNLPEQDEPSRLPVLSLTRTLIVEDVELRLRVEDGQTTFDLRWQEPVRLKNRCVRFWPLWRPWEAPFEQPIPDAAEGMYTFGIEPDALRPGKYRLEFFIADPWAPPVTPDKPPPAGTPGTADIELIALEERLERLNARLQEQGQQFALLLERTAIYHDVGDLAEARSDWQWCFEHLDEGTVPQILALVRLVEAAGDPATHRALQMKMFAPDRVESLLRAHSQGEVSTDHFKRYLTSVPRSGLLPKATCKQLLLVGEEAIRLHVVQQLIRRGDALGVKAVLEWVEAFRLSDADAVALLAMNPNFAVECLQGKTDNPLTRRLLNDLSRFVEAEGIARVGDWVHCDAGLGRIERIVNSRTGAEVQWIAGKRSNYQLEVTLRPDVSAEHIMIDLAAASARFQGQGEILTCGGCQGFSTQRKDVLERHFQRAHPSRVKKEQIAVRYYHKPGKEPISLQVLEFRSEGPSDQLV